MTGPFFIVCLNTWCAQPTFFFRHLRPCGRFSLGTVGGADGACSPAGGFGDRSTWRTCFLRVIGRSLVLGRRIWGGSVAGMGPSCQKQVTGGRLLRRLRYLFEPLNAWRLPSGVLRCDSARRLGRPGLTGHVLAPRPLSCQVLGFSAGPQRGTPSGFGFGPGGPNPRRPAFASR